MYKELSYIMPSLDLHSKRMNECNPTFNQWKIFLFQVYSLDLVSLWCKTWPLL